jgi:hypothetical protein
LVRYENCCSDDQANKDKPNQAATQETENKEGHYESDGDDNYGRYRHAYTLSGKIAASNMNSGKVQARMLHERTGDQVHLSIYIEMATPEDELRGG